MSISRKSQAPVGIVNASGQPEIVLALDGLVLSMKPPASADDVTAADAAEGSEPEAGADLTEE
ncbi:MAG: hypothetical protein ABMA25_23510 [Ilumatobacteraceae bacterium]